MTDISEEVHEFRQGSPSRLFTIILQVLQIDSNKSQRLWDLVTEKVNKKRQLSNSLSNDAFENDTITRKTRDQITLVKITDNEDEVEALVSLCKIIFAVVFIKKEKGITSSVSVKYYGENYSFEQCAYIIYDEKEKHYASLYLFDKNNPDQLITIFDRKNSIIKKLLPIFFKEHLKYNGIVQLYDQNDTAVLEVLTVEQNESDDTPVTMISNIRKDTSKSQMRTDNACLPMLNTNISTATTSGDIQLSLNWQRQIVYSEHEFGRKMVPRDGSCFYWSFIHVMNQLIILRVEDLREKVADYISSLNTYDAILLADTRHQTRAQYCNGIRNNEWGGEPEILALTELYHIVIVVVNVITDENGELTGTLIKYGETNQSLKTCVYIMYNSNKQHYEPLYLSEKNDSTKHRTIFDRDDPVLDVLVDDFIRNGCPYNDGFEMLHEVELPYKSDTLYPGNNFEDTIPSNPTINIPQQNNTSGNDEVSYMKGTISNTRHEFRIGELPGDEQCLFASVIHLFDRSQTINMKSLREKVIDFIRQSETIDELSFLYNPIGETLEDYCLKIRRGTICDSIPQRRALACVYPNILFCIISKTTIGENKSQFNIDTYVKDLSCYTKCIVIIYNEADNTYRPLYLHDKINDEEEKSNFKYNDTVKILLVNLIRHTLHDNGRIIFSDEIMDFEIEPEASADSEFLDVFDQIVTESNVNKLQQPSVPTQEPHEKSINKSNPMNTHVKKTASRKRKTPEDDESSLIHDLTKKSLSSISSVNTASTSRSIPSNDASYTEHQKCDASNSIEKLLQADMFATGDFLLSQAMNQENIEMSSKTLPPKQLVSHDPLGLKMKFENEIIPGFRGRLESEYRPKKQTKRNGTKAETKKPPNYFADIHNQHHLNLLISETLLCGDLHRVCVEITIVTPTINECIYIHPYFKFYIVRNGSEPLTMNPLHIYLGFDEFFKVTNFSEGMKNILLYLPVIMLKHDELLHNQPMQPFQSLLSNGQADTTRYDKIDAFINKFHLNVLRFAVTLWIKSHHDNQYHRCLDRQYISGPSTQDKNFKVTEYLKKMINSL